MLNTAVGIQSPSSLGGGQYSLSLYFQSSSKASFMRIGDTLKDSTGNEYSVTTWATYPTDFSSGGSVTVTFITVDTLPQVDVGFNSTVFTPNQVDVRPPVQTPGSIYSISLVSGQDFEYQASASWTINSEALQAVVGDRIVDSSGKEYEISFLDVGHFTVPFKMKEVEYEGISPAVGIATLYRPTSNYDFFQGSALTDPARTNIFNRDQFLVDTILSAAGTGSGEAVASTVTNDSGGTLLALTPVRSDSVNGMDTIDVSVESEVDALIGVLNADTNDGDPGTVTNEGRIKDITTAISTDTAVYLSKTGTLTDTKPSIGVGGFAAGDFVVLIGVVTKNEDNPSNKDLVVNMQLIGQL